MGSRATIYMIESRLVSAREAALASALAYVREVKSEMEALETEILEEMRLRARTRSVER